MREGVRDRDRGRMVEGSVCLREEEERKRVVGRGRAHIILLHIKKKMAAFFFFSIFIYWSIASARG